MNAIIPVAIAFLLCLCGWDIVDISIMKHFLHQPSWASIFPWFTNTEVVCITEAEGQRDTYLPYLLCFEKTSDLEYAKEIGRQKVILKSGWIIKVMWNITLRNVIQSSGIAECYLGPDLMLNIIQTFKQKPTLFGSLTPHMSIPALFWKCVLTQDVDLVMLFDCPCVYWNQIFRFQLCKME